MADVIHLLLKSMNGSVLMGTMNNGSNVPTNSILLRSRRLAIALLAEEPVLEPVVENWRLEVATRFNTEEVHLCSA
jgi:hypothetical protein